MATRYMASTPLKKLLALILAGACVFSVPSVFAGTGTKAKDVETNTSAFNNNLNASDTTVQKALDNIDKLAEDIGNAKVSLEEVDKAFPQIIAQILAHFVGISIVVQHIVDHLECGAQSLAVARAGVFYFWRTGCQNGRETRAGLKQLGRF